MKTLCKVILLFFFSVLVFQPVHGQNILKRLKQKAQEKIEEKVEERAEEKMDEKIDESLDKIEDSMEKNDSETAGSEESSADRSAKMQNRMQGLLKGMGMSGEPVPVADNYNFDYKIQMHIESYDKKGKQESTGEFITHLNPKTKSMAYEFVSGDMAKDGQGMFIIDAENDAMIILNDEKGEKTGIVYGIGSFFQTIGETYIDEELEDTPDNYLANPNVKKTGKTKNIAGYKCEEYVYTDEENKTKSNIWITKDLKMNTQDFFSTLFKTNLYSHGMGWGYMMEATTENLENNEKTTMQVTEVDNNSNVSFSLGNYQITNLGSFTMPVTEEEK
ncbi:DUF4412 domain-containing protein [Maribellus maritimus]|uniref:DUF4412 domain-containing protein n=1 Tax=Maribellus maritimus TaxID=2870838 RepID=UPI001EEBDA36|nr:DUF4412 domain-containing protein [Maribellus maritimus]MCG6188378.1 DUF4412 domain-containing protein [Maribellus maritimus]